MLEVLASYVVGLIGATIRDWLADMRRERDLRKLGAAEAALETSRTIQEIADAQHRNDLVDRRDVDAVARRLRRRLDAERERRGSG